MTCLPTKLRLLLRFLGGKKSIPTLGRQEEMLVLKLTRCEWIVLHENVIAPMHSRSGKTHVGLSPRHAGNLNGDRSKRLRTSRDDGVGLSA